MSVNPEKYKELIKELGAAIQLVAVSKTKSITEIKEVYDLGQRDFGENYVQELVEKQAALPKDIRWHFIGHLQSNKVKFIAPFVHLIQGVDSLKLLAEINKQGERYDRVMDCLLQIHIAEEETKFGFDEKELEEALRKWQSQIWPQVMIRGLMGMASFTGEAEKIAMEFRRLRKCYERIPNATILSMGMTGDYRIALTEGSNMVRIGSMIFGERNASHL